MPYAPPSPEVWLSKSEAAAEGLLTTEEACRYAGISYSMLRKMHSKGEIFPRALVGITHYYSIDNLDKLRDALGMNYDEKQHLTVEKAADYLGCYKSHVSQYAKPIAYCLINGKKRAIYKRRDLWIAKKKMKKDELARRKSAARKKTMLWIDSERRRELIAQRGNAGFISKFLRKRKTVSYYQYVAQITICGRRYRKFSRDRQELESWLAHMTRQQESPQCLRNMPPAHIDGWLHCREVRELIAKSNPYAPKNYAICNLVATSKAGFRNVRWMKKSGLLYVNERDFMREMKRLPFYERYNHITRKSWVVAPYHSHLPEELVSDDWMPIKQAAEILGEKINRLRVFVRRYTLRAYMYQGRLCVNINEARELCYVRHPVFLRKRGLDPNDYPVAKIINFYGAQLRLRYAPDLIGK